MNKKLEPVAAKLPYHNKKIKQKITLPNEFLIDQKIFGYSKDIVNYKCVTCNHYNLNFLMYQDVVILNDEVLRSYPVLNCLNHSCRMKHEITDPKLLEFAMSLQYLAKLPKGLRSYTETQLDQFKITKFANKVEMIHCPSCSQYNFEYGKGNTLRVLYGFTDTDPNTEYLKKACLNDSCGHTFDLSEKELELIESETFTKTRRHSIKSMTSEKLDEFEISGRSGVSFDYECLQCSNYMFEYAEMKPKKVVLKLSEDIGDLNYVAICTKCGATLDLEPQNRPVDLTYESKVKLGKLDKEGYVIKQIKNGQLTPLKSGEESSKVKFYAPTTVSKWMGALPKIIGLTFVLFFIFSFMLFLGPEIGFPIALILTLVFSFYKISNNPYPEFLIDQERLKIHIQDIISISSTHKEKQIWLFHKQAFIYYIYYMENDKVENSAIGFQKFISDKQRTKFIDLLYKYGYIYQI